MEKSILDATRELFVKFYYKLQNQKPSDMYKFYNDESSYIRGETYKNGKPGEIIIGRENIKRKIESVGFKGCKTKIRQVDALQTLGNSLTLQVIGVMSIKKSDPYRPFVQTFVLTPKDEATPLTFYVHNDMFRYQDNVFLGDPECDNSAANNRDLLVLPLVAVNINQEKRAYESADQQQEATTSTNEESVHNDTNSVSTSKSTNDSTSNSTSDNSNDTRSYSTTTIDSIHDSTSDASNDTRSDSTCDSTSSGSIDTRSYSTNDSTSDTRSDSTSDSTSDTRSDLTSDSTSDTRSNSTRDSEHSTPSKATEASSQGKASKKATATSKKNVTKVSEISAVSWADVLKTKTPNTTTAYISTRAQHQVEAKAPGSAKEIQPTKQRSPRSNETTKHSSTNKFEMNPERNTSPSYQNNQQIYVSRIKPYLTDDDLWNFFEGEYGVVIDVIRFGSLTGLNSALVVFKDPRTVDKIMGQNETKTVWCNDNDEIDIRRKRERRKRTNDGYNKRRGDSRNYHSNHRNNEDRNYSANRRETRNSFQEVE